MTTIGVKNHRMKILFFYSSTSEYDRAMKSSLTRGKQQGHSVGDLGATMHVNKTTMARAEVVRSSDSPQLSPLRHVGALRTRTTAVHLTTEALLRSQTLGTSRLQSTSTHRLGIFRFRAGLLYFCGTDSGFALAERPFSSPRRRGRCWPHLNPQCECRQEGWGARGGCGSRPFSNLIGGLVMWSRGILTYPGIVFPRHVSVQRTSLSCNQRNPPSKNVLSQQLSCGKHIFSGLLNQCVQDGQLLLRQQHVHADWLRNGDLRNANLWTPACFQQKRRGQPPKYGHECSLLQPSDR